MKKRHNWSVICWWKWNIVGAQVVVGNHHCLQEMRWIRFLFRSNWEELDMNWESEQNEKRRFDCIPPPPSQWDASHYLQRSRNSRKTALSCRWGSFWISVANLQDVDVKNKMKGVLNQTSTLQSLLATCYSHVMKKRWNGEEQSWEIGAKREFVKVVLCCHLRDCNKVYKAPSA